MTRQRMGKVPSASEIPVPTKARPHLTKGAVAFACMRVFVVFLACALTVLSFVHVMPIPPQDGLDPSWKYAVDFAAAHGMVFGRDIVFTFGPLASIYTDFRVPEHDKLYLATATIVALGAFAGFLIVSASQRFLYLLILPFILCNILIKDAILLILPLTLALASCRRPDSSTAWHPAFALIAVANGLLLLVKGSLVLPVTVCTALSCVALARDRSHWSIVLPLVVSGTALCTWLSMGQSLASLPSYVANFAKITHGYTDAMSMTGPLVHPIAFIGSSVILVAVLVWIEPRHRLVVALSSLFVGFVTFKAGFVRQDGHATLAASFLALLGILILVRTADRRAYFGLVGLAGWFVRGGSGCLNSGVRLDKWRSAGFKLPRSAASG